MQQYNVAIMQFHFCDVLLINPFSDVTLLIYGDPHFRNSSPFSGGYLTLSFVKAAEPRKASFFWNKTDIFFVNNSND